MKPLDLIASAWRGVTSNMVRSVLTALGIVIGVAAVIVLVAVGNGSAQAISDSISSLGTTTITVQGGRGSSTFELSTRMVDALEDERLAPDVASVSPVVTSSTTAVNGTASTSVQVTGTTPDWFAASAQSLQFGSAFTESDVDGAAKVIVLGAAPAEDLFGSARAALNQQVLVGDTYYTVVGVLEEASSTGFGNSSAIAVAPLTTVQAHLSGYGALGSLVVLASDEDHVDAAMAEIETVLRGMGHLSADDSLPFSLQNASSLLETRESTSQTFTTLLGVVAGISLLVGGLGITTSMLMSVTERTREIGVRKALGAPKRTIWGQFLLEAAALSIGGGLIGVAVGFVISRFTILGIQPVVSSGSVTLALGVCAVIGLFFGSVPAHRASSLRPVEALRHE